MTNIVLEGLVEGKWEKIVKLRYNYLKELKEGWTCDVPLKNVEKVRLRVDK